MADDMGLGKTLQVLGFLISMLEKGIDGPFLVVAPVTILDTWSSELASKFLAPYNQKIFEIHKMFLDKYGVRGALVSQRDGQKVKLKNKKVLCEEGTNIIKNADIIVTNYETIREYQLSFGEIPFKVLVCDEAQRIKNPSTHVTNALKAMNAEFRIISTATPVENSLIDLWCIVDFLSPGLLGSLNQFKKKYIKENMNDINTADVNDLRELLNKNNLILRRTKESQLPDLPQKHIYVNKVFLSDCQYKLYKQLIHVASNDSKQVLGVIISLIALCSHPSICTPGDFQSRNIEYLIDDCPKLEWTLKLLEKIKQKEEKVLIFTRLKKMQEILISCICHYMGDYYLPELINGDTPVNKRQKIVNKFNRQDGFGILILSPEAAGIGLNIIGANNVIHYTRLWNPAKEDQATDRVYRIGQERDVHVYYPITVFPEKINTKEQTIEQRLDVLLKSKRGIMKQFLIPTEKLNITADELWTSLDIKESKGISEPLTASDVDRLDSDQFELLVFLLFKLKFLK